jgi:hypothetical protein
MAYVHEDRISVFGHTTNGERVLEDAGLRHCPATDASRTVVVSYERLRVLDCDAVFIVPAAYATQAAVDAIAHQIELLNRQPLWSAFDVVGCSSELRYRYPCSRAHRGAMTLAIRVLICVALYRSAPIGRSSPARPSYWSVATKSTPVSIAACHRTRAAASEPKLYPALQPWSASGRNPSSV